jgi:hypothetical protein
MLISLNGTNSKDEVYPVILNTDDISVVKPSPYQDRQAKSVVSLRSQPDHGLWVVETVDEITDLIAQQF